MRTRTMRRKAWLVAALAVAMVFCFVAFAFAGDFSTGGGTTPTFTLYYEGDTVNYWLYLEDPGVIYPNGTGSTVTDFNFTKPDGTVFDIANNVPVGRRHRIEFYPNEIRVINTQTSVLEAQYFRGDAIADPAWAFTYAASDLEWVVDPAFTGNPSGNYFTATCSAIGSQSTGTGGLSEPFAKADTIIREMLISETEAGVNIDVTPIDGKKTVHVGDAVSLTVTEKNTGSYPLSAAKVVLDRIPAGAGYPTDLNFINRTSSDLNADDMLDPGETWTWVVPGVVITEHTTFTGVGSGIDVMGNIVTIPVEGEPLVPWVTEKEYAEDEIFVITPDTVMSVDALPGGGEYSVGDMVTAYFHEENTGDVVLTDVHAKIFVDGIEVDDIAKGSDLAVGEIWDFDYTKAAVAPGETICAIGFGTDPLGKVVTWDEYPAERACVEYTIVYHPNTEMSVEALPNSGTYYVGDMVTAYFHEENTGDVVLTDVHAKIFVNDVEVDDIAKGSDLAVGEIWDFDYSKAAVDGGETICAVGFGTDPSGEIVTWSDKYPAEKACVDYCTITPGTEMSVDALPNGGVYADGADVTAFFHEENTGDVVLTDVHAKIFVDDVEVTDIAKGSDLAVGEIWDFDYTTPAVAPGQTICAVGFGTDPLGKVITWDEYPEKACVEYTVETGGPTRTVGFWQTHWDYTLVVFEDYLGGSIELCDGNPIDSMQKLEAILNYDSILTNRQLNKMSPYEIMWLNCARQYVGAVLNQAAFGTAPNYMGAPIDFADVREALCTGDADAIGSYLMKLDWFNNSGDDFSLYGADPNYPDDMKYWGNALPQKTQFEGSKAIGWARLLP